MPLPVTYCTIEGCEKKNFGHGMCSMHYTRNRTHGSPHKVMNIVGNPDLAFWSKVNKTETCWNWTATKCLNGYGRIMRFGKLRAAHRVSYEMAFGPIADGMDIDHQCHNPACVNPEHLKEVSHKQNAENRAGAEVRSKSGIRGVSWNERLKHWYVQVKHNGVNHHIGKFRTAAQAERAAIMKRLELFTNSVTDKGIPENIQAIHAWHQAKHSLNWDECVYEPCQILDVDFREAWS